MTSSINIFTKNAKSIMSEFDFFGFKRKYRRLFIAIHISLEEYADARVDETTKHLVAELEAVKKRNAILETVINELP